jgi:hypothetical protein
MSKLGNLGTISWCATQAGPYVALADIIEFASNSIKVPGVDTKKLDSVADTSLPGTANYGSVAVTLEYTAAQTAIIMGWIAAKAVNYFKIEPADKVGAGSNSNEAFQAWVEEYTPIEDFKLDGRLQSKVTLHITGVATFTPAA